MKRVERASKNSPSVWIWGVQRSSKSERLLRFLKSAVCVCAFFPKIGWIFWGSGRMDVEKAKKSWAFFKSPPRDFQRRRGWYWVKSGCLRAIDLRFHGMSTYPGEPYHILGKIFSHPKLWWRNEPIQLCDYSVIWKDLWCYLCATPQLIIVLFHLNFKTVLVLTRRWSAKHNLTNGRREPFASSSAPCPLYLLAKLSVFNALNNWREFCVPSRNPRTARWTTEYSFICDKAILTPPPHTHAHISKTLWLKCGE